MITDHYFISAMIRAIEAHAEVRSYDDNILYVAIAGIAVAFISIVGSILVTIWIYKKQNAIVEEQMKIANKQISISERQTDIAEQQNKIALFEKRYEVYRALKNMLKSNNSFKKGVEPVSFLPMQLAIIAQYFSFDPNVEGNKFKQIQQHFAILFNKIDFNKAWR